MASIDITTSNGLPGTAGADAAPAPAARVPETVHDLRREVAELARSLPGDLRRVAVRNGDCTIEVEWATGEVDEGAPRRAARPLASDAAADEAPQDVLVSTVPVRAPLVGTYYAAPSPGKDPFVKVGDEVEPGQTLAIVEAMKLMNPIVAAQSGVVAEIVVSDGDSVEYDQVLILLLPPEHPK